MAGQTAQIELPPKLIPVFAGEARYRGAWGGRGSGKTRSFAKMSAVRGYQLSQAGEEGIILCGRQFMNSLDDSSLAEVKAVACCRFRGHRDRVFDGTGGLECGEGSSAASSSLRR